MSNRGRKKGVDGGRKRLTSASGKGRGRKTSSTNRNSAAEEADNIYACGACQKMVDDDDDSIMCNKCRNWIHKSCTSLKDAEFEVLTCGNEGIAWTCPPCLKDQGKETKKFLQLEKKLDMMIDRLDGFEERMIERMEERMTKKVTEMEERLTKSNPNPMSEEKLEAKIKMQITESIEEQKEAEEKKNNLIIFNINESSGEKENTKEDIAKIENLLATIIPEIKEEPETEMEISRLGKNKPTNGAKPRPIRIIFKSGELRRKVLGNAKELKGNKKYTKVGISTDKTTKERNQEQLLRAEYAKRKAKKEDVIIDFSEKKVILRSESRFAQRNNAEQTAEKIPEN